MLAFSFPFFMVIVWMVKIVEGAASSMDVNLLVEKKGNSGSKHATILFVGDSTVVQGDNKHGFIDVLQMETADSPLGIEAASSLDFDIDRLNEGLIDHYIKIYKPDVVVLMLFDDVISSLVEELASGKEGDMSHESLRSRLEPLKRKLELTIAHVKRDDSSIEIVISTPLVFHVNEEIVELVCECFGGMLKRVSFDYKVGLVDLRFPLLKIFEHHTNFDQIRHQNTDVSVPKALKGMVLPVTVKSQTQNGKCVLSKIGHAVLAHSLVTYFGLEAYELANSRSLSSEENLGDGGDVWNSARHKTIRERIIASHLDGHLKGSGVTHKHLDAWHKDSAVAILANHKEREAAVLRMEHEHQRRIEEQIRLSNMPSSGNLEMPEDGSGMTASQKKRAKKKGKRKAQPKPKARREEL